MEAAVVAGAGEGGLPDEEAGAGAPAPAHMGTPCGNCCPNEQTRKDKPLRLISISHGWLTPDHPDPSGQQLEKFAEMVRRERQCWPGDGCDVCCRVCGCALTLGFIPGGYCSAASSCASGSAAAR